MIDRVSNPRYDDVVDHCILDELSEDCEMGIFLLKDGTIRIETIYWGAETKMAIVNTSLDQMKLLSARLRSLIETAEKGKS